MRDPMVIAVLFRSLERLLIMASGTLAIWLGYRLFDKVVSDTGSVAASRGEWSIKLQRIGPGVFFALFGAAILGSSVVLGPVSAEYARPGAPDPAPAGSALQPRGPDGISIRYGQDSAELLTDRDEAERAIRAATTLQQLVSASGLVAGVPAADQPVFLDALGTLVRYRETLIDGLYGQGTMARYLDLAEELRRNPDRLAQLSAQERDRHERIRRLLQAGTPPS